MKYLFIIFLFSCTHICKLEDCKFYGTKTQDLTGYDSLTREFWELHLKDTSLTYEQLEFKVLNK
jgi:hypothetical protein